jgi:uncharacterized RDD family membrane protein YckC
LPFFNFFTLENTDQHILDEPQNILVRANWAKRLANYFIDLFAFSILLTILLTALAPVFPLVGRWMQPKPGSSIFANQFSFSDQLLISFIYGFYMSVLEAALKGKSFGKLITGTRVVDLKGQRISSQAAFVRGLVRLIPLEQLSALSILPFPWHDRWSGTMVVNER